MAVVGLIPERKKVIDIRKYYVIKEREIKKELLAFAAGEFSELKAMKLLRRIDVMIERMNIFVRRWSRRAALLAYKDSVAVTRTSLRILGARSNPEFDKTLHRRTILKYSNQMIEQYLKANVSIRQNVDIFVQLARSAGAGLEQFQAFDPLDEAAVGGIIAETYAEGQSRKAAAKIVYAYFKDKIGDGQFILIKGRNYQMGPYSKMVARTELRKAQSDGVRNMCAQYDNDLVQISDHGTECEICKEFEGNIYSISGRNPEYDQLPEEPPYHPNCEHSMTPTSAEAIEFREKFS